MKVTPAALQAAGNGDIKNFIAASTPGGIEAQEAAGQKGFVADQTLPKECPREALEKLGFVFGDNADDIFIHVQFPEGWKKEPTDHSMWNDLIDDKGRKRGGIFYKAAFYDRSAHMSLSRRFSHQRDYDHKTGVQFIAFDSGNEIHRTELIEIGELSKENMKQYWAAEDKATDEVLAYLSEHHPEWEDVSAYWD